MFRDHGDAGSGASSGFAAYDQLGAQAVSSPGAVGGGTGSGVVNSIVPIGSYTAVASASVTAK